MNIQKRSFVALIALLFAVSSPTTFGDWAGNSDGHAGHLKVMTQNLYVGANLFKILGDEDTGPEDVPFIAAEIFGDIQMTDFRQRAEAIADGIARHRPHLIGLQEVSLIRTQCPDDIVFPPNDPAPNAADVYADYLQLLLEALDARGLRYEVAAMVKNADVELPVANLGLLDCEYPLFDARLTDFDVTLKRSDVDVTFSVGQNYLANFPVPTPAGPIVFNRGYNIVDVGLGGRSYRFVNTHLEVSGNRFANGFQFAQAVELTQILETLAAGRDEIVVLVGDLNSDPAEGPLVDCMLPPTFDTLGLCPTPYTVMASNGYTDTWTVRNGKADDGYTCCQQDLLTNDESWLDERIDHIWVRPPVGGAQGPHFLRAVHAMTVGDRQRDRTASWLWPSDHAGVVAGMTLRQEEQER
ncbi:MAG: endonuclease/exonuclease/phosphatase family protein [Gammaproteobacteria bacterium]|nr:endonuclease/exonuclease/phosphatase family protein [Gammaproteobacteria bacterium]